jgi:hypothetical protein
MPRDYLEALTITQSLMVITGWEFLDWRCAFSHHLGDYFTKAIQREGFQEDGHCLVRLSEIHPILA